eukprot:GFKZ01005983.1.p1 GENE.GFKZ01005983.1~~GFKZ01005983.1.p1  ORF type:complete len:340 (-),score=35.66 GFKZ01005983.1:230-1219(-)
MSFLSLPPLPSTTRLPRKTLRRLRRDLSLTLTLLALILLLHYHHHYHTPPFPNPTPRQTPTHLTSIPRNIYYLNHEPVLYCYIPKNACSRFKPLLRKREGFTDWNDTSLIHGKKNGLQRLQWLPFDVAMPRLSNPAWKKFVVVRDPFARLISAYQNKIATPWPDQRRDFWEKHLTAECPRMMSALTMPESGALLSLADFLRCLLEEGGESNEHWRPQSQLCGLDYVKYDRYLAVERLDQGVEEMLRWLGWQTEAAAGERVGLKRDAVYARDLAEYFTPETVAMALQYYKEDFDVLRYPRVPKGRIEFYSVFNGTNFQPGFVLPNHGKQV